MTRFDYKPALLAQRLSYDLDADAVVCRDSHEVKKWRINWDQIGSAVYVEHNVRRARMRRLDLLRVGGNGRHSISYTGARGTSTANPDRVTHLDLMAAVLDRLAAGDPDFQVGIGEYGRYRIALFVIGLLSVVSAIGLAILLLATGLTSDRILAGALPGALLVALGGALVYTHAPWRKRPRLSAATLALALRRMAHPTGQ